MDANKRVWSVATILAGSLAVCPAQAQKPEGSGWYLKGSAYKTHVREARNQEESTTTTPGPLGVTTTTTRAFTTEYDRDVNGGLSIGYDFPGIFRADLEYREFDNEIDRLTENGVQSDPEGEIDSRSMMFNLWLDFNRDGNVLPYVGLGAGAVDLTQFGDEADSDALFLAQAGAGINWYVSERLSFDLGYRYAESDEPTYKGANRVTESEYEREGFTLGLRFNFYDRHPEVDSDRDGVWDRNDQCPGTPAGAQVDSRGCALDSDKDGVVDHRDDCAATPPGTKVDRRGCALDDDNDGVTNAADQCPDTKAGQKVLENGCVELTLRGVHFEFNSERLTANAKAICRDTAGQLQRDPDVRVEVQGHTDNKGAAGYNLKLSQDRAQSFVNCLVDNGIDRSRLRAKGYGESNPIASNDTPEGRAENRRVTLSVINR